jgi:hypothetical protein
LEVTYEKRKSSSCRVIVLHPVVRAGTPADSRSDASSNTSKAQDLCHRQRLLVGVRRVWREQRRVRRISKRGGARPQTAEIIKTIGERCKDSIVTIDKNKADYILILDHEGGKSVVRKDNKFAIFNKSGDAIRSGSTRNLGLTRPRPLPQVSDSLINAEIASPAARSRFICPRVIPIDHLRALSLAEQSGRNRIERHPFYVYFNWEATRLTDPTLNAIAKSPGG